MAVVKTGKQPGNAISIKDYERDTPSGFHSFSGNDYISVLFRKGKKSCWKLLIKNEQFLQAFRQLENTLDFETYVIDKLELYVCCLYGSKKKSVNAARFDMFIKNNNFHIITLSHNTSLKNDDFSWNCQRQQNITATIPSTFGILQCWVVSTLNSVVKKLWNNVFFLKEQIF